MASTAAFPPGSVGYLAFPGQLDFLLSELQDRFGLSPQDIAGARRHEDLLLLKPDVLPEILCGPHPATIPYWASTVLQEPAEISFNSIGEAASALKAIQRSWAPYPTTSFRRSQLIQEKLPYMNLKPRKFPCKVPSSTCGLYSLTGHNTLIASARTSSVFPLGLIQLVEDRENPPSRAYLKLQEALTQGLACFGRMPQEGQRCLDTGACPGGWTWVLVQLGCTVLSVDRRPLAPQLMEHPLVSFQRHDAFTLPPEELGAFDWIFSDVICYPARLLEWIHRWLESGLCANMVCTIKMQGRIDWALVDQFASIPNSKVLHLHYNKHELTWIHCH